MVQTPLTDPPLAAYHGTGWQPRTGTLGAELRAGLLWRRAGYDSEWAPLRAAMLALPQADWPAPSDWNLAQYLAPVDFARLRDELLGYAEILRRLSVEVVLRELPGDAARPPRYNGVFVRDQYAMTPEGAVVARMGSLPRAGEELETTRALAGYGVPILRTVGGAASFEGADALWLRPDLVLIGVGNRTCRAGAAQVGQVLRDLGVRVRTVGLPRQVQHLLGLCQLVAPDLAVVRTALAPPTLRRVLRQAGIGVLDVAETPEVTRRQAMNFVTVAERRVVLPDDVPELRDRLVGAGVAIAAEVRCVELRKAAGGLACATGPLCRESVRGEPAPVCGEPAPVGGEPAPVCGEPAPVGGEPAAGGGAR